MKTPIKKLARANTIAKVIDMKSAGVASMAPRLAVNSQPQMNSKRFALVGVTVATSAEGDEYGLSSFFIIIVLHARTS